MGKKGPSTLGYGVDKSTLNHKSADAVIALRVAFDKVETLAKWLTNHPKENDIDPLVEEFAYTDDEAYALRLFFETFDSIRKNNASTFDVGRAMTGLE